MGRLLKQVPLDFDWGLNEVWSGYVNPHQRHKCNACEGLGYSKEYKELEKKWYGHDEQLYLQNPYRPHGRYNSLAWNNNLTQDDVNALIEADRLWDFTRVPLNEEQKKIVKQKIASGENSWLPFNNGYIPTAKEVNEWNLKGMGHDSSNAWIVIKARLKREGKPSECSKCNGTGEKWQSQKAKELYENWTEYDPPIGEGFQLWENTSEGSPITPVFESLELLCEWCEKNEVSVFGNHTATKEEWISMLKKDFVCYQTGNMVFI